MLLYDRVIEHAVRMKRATPEKFREGNAELLQSLRQAAVYELTDVVPLVQDWAAGRNQPIPKRPPHLTVWAEWRTEMRHAGGVARWVLGVCIAELSPAIDSEVALSPNLHGAARLAYLDVTRDRYMSMPFMYLENGVGELMSADGYLLWSMKPDGTDVQHYRVGSRQCYFGLPPVDFTGLGPEYFQWAVPWPPFMAFALLHCKNVVTETVEPDAATQRRVIKAGNPPRASYRVLKIEVPQTAAGSKPSRLTDGDDGPKVRFHLCRGHFKSLQADRFKSKGWHWWPAHWRGSRALGRVEKRYELTGGGK